MTGNIFFLKIVELLPFDQKQLCDSETPCNDEHCKKLLLRSSIRIDDS